MKTHHTAAARFTWTALLLVLMGLCASSSPHRIASAALHHRQAPGTTHRVSRQGNRSARGGLFTEAEDHDCDTTGSMRAAESCSTHLLARALTAAVPVQTFRLLKTVLARGQLPPDEPDAIISSNSLPHSGRAPPSL